MAADHTIFRTGFGRQSFEIDCNNKDALWFAEFLLSDLPGTELPEYTRHYDILSVGPQPILSLWEGDKRLYLGQSRYQLAYMLMNEVVFHCINSNKKQHALHAGAVRRGDRCLIIPGKSGRGKSTLTAWLIANGYEYLTDELIFLADDGSLLPLTRPISLKVNERHSSWLLENEHADEIISCDQGAMIPHRLLNPTFSTRQSQVTDIIYPEFREGATGRLTEISPAKSVLYLVQSHVNARNFDGHGITAISAIVRRCRSYCLTYGGFADLEAFFSPSGSFA